jgi:hypothetical protein
VKDVKQVSGNELILRKVNLVLTKMNPAKVLRDCYFYWIIKMIAFVSFFFFTFNRC